MIKRQFKFTGWWLTGFTQADGSFMIGFRKRKDYKVGYQVAPIFIITQSVSEMDMIIALHRHIGVGTVKLDSSTKSVVLEVTSIPELLAVILPHFDKYPLKGRKTYCLYNFS